MSIRLFVLALVLANGCQFLTAADNDTFKVGLICSGSTSDGGWNQLAKEGLESLQKAMGAQVTSLQKITPDKAGDEMRSFAADGYNLVIAHGYEFLNPAADVASTPGKTHFAVSGADIAKPGLVTLDFDLSQASYQAGMLAAQLSHSGKLGFIGGEKIPSVQACYRGFLAGAQSIKPSITVVEAYTGWDQPEKAKSQAEALFQEGVDGIFHDVDAASLGIFEAVKEHNQALSGSATPVYVFGSCADQNANAVCSKWTPASAVIRLDRTFLVLAQSIKDGTFKAGVVRENLQRGTCVLVVNPALVADKTITQEMQDQIDAAGKKLISGELTIGAH
jgi:basic membrane protein A